MTHWQPTRVFALKRTLGTSTRALHVETDAGDAVIKTLGNPEGPQVLAKELIAARLAAAFGLPVFDFAAFELHDDDAELIRVSGAKFVEAGPCFATRFDFEGHEWDGSERAIDSVERLNLARLVVFDTWLINRDRRRPDRYERLGNVFIRPGAGALREIVAFDHTHVMRTDITPKLAQISSTNDPTILGLFPAFAARIDVDDYRVALRDLASLTDAQIDQSLGGLPAEWAVGAEERRVIAEFLRGRRAFLVDRFLDLVSVATQTTLNLPSRDGEPPTRH